jgi:RNA 3'-terminal phosphate cyclase (ATP)
LSDLKSGATLDHYAADQVVPFAALGDGESRFHVPEVTDHLVTNGWLAQLFLGTRISMEGKILAITGVGYVPHRTR